MMLFPAYALVVWYFAMKWRRMWRGFAAVALGTLGVHFVAMLYMKIGLLFGMSRVESMLLLLYPFAGMVAVVGLYLALLPRVAHEACRQCGYSLHGLEERGRDGLIVCPECGCRHAVAQPSDPNCTQCGHAVRPHGRDDWLCTGCGVHHIERVVVYSKPPPAPVGRVAHDTPEPTPAHSADAA